MHYIYNGNIIVPKEASFDIIGQMYKHTVEEYSYWDSWRRESGRYGCQKRVIEIYIATNTPHVIKMESNGYDEAGICMEIFNMSYRYLDYAVRKLNLDWVGSTLTDYQWVYDRVEKEYLVNDFISKGVDVSLVSIRNAY